MKETDYIKLIINEYANRLKLLGPVENWGVSQFRTLEDLIFDSTKVRVNAKTLERFFNQHTSNPQIATKDALCQFLGYANYAEFVLKKSEIHSSKNDKPEKEPEQADIANEKIEPTAKPKKRKQKLSFIFLLVVLCSIGLYFVYTHKLKDVYTNFLLSKVDFAPTSSLKGLSPLTVSLHYDIPQFLLDDMSIDYVESNGDTFTQEISSKENKVNRTFVYDGRGFVYLKHKGEIIKTIVVESRKPGWTINLRDDKTNFFKSLPIENSFIKENHLSLPPSMIPEKGRTEQLFVSYVYYKDQLVDGDNFTVEAKLRNAEEDNAIPWYDVMVYAYSKSGEHGMALTQKAYSYNKFVSGDKLMKGDQYDLSHINFVSSKWHVMKIHVKNKKATYYIDNKEVISIDYTTSLGMIDEIVLRFKGCGAIEFMRVFDDKEKLIHETVFNL